MDLFQRRAFTLIELLIVVAIIAILAAIAVPNFLEAQTRAKVTRVRNDMRTIATALEAYKVDRNRYPYDGYTTSGDWSPLFNYWYIPTHLSTPVAYVTSVLFKDPFRDTLKPDVPERWQWDNLRYTNINATWGTDYYLRTGGSATSVSPYYDHAITEFGDWRLNGAGPDRVYGPNGWTGVYGGSGPRLGLPHPYDASNGTISDGDIIRTQRSSSGYLNASN